MRKKTQQWLSLVGIIWLQSVNGTNTNFPAYSSQLKQLLSLSQLQLNNLAFASDSGKVFGFISGIAALYFPLWLVLLIGSFLGLLGYGIQYLFVTNYITSLSYAHVFLLTVLAGNSICWINTVCYVVAINNFPCHRQLAAGLTVSYQGLSAKIYAVLVESMFVGRSGTQKSKGYLVLSSILPLLVSTMAAMLVRDLKTEINLKVCDLEEMDGGFVSMIMITIATGVYAIWSSLRSISQNGSSTVSNYNVLGILIFLLAPLSIPIFIKLKSINNKCINKRKHETNATSEVVVVNIGEVGKNNDERDIQQQEAEKGLNTGTPERMAHGGDDNEEELVMGHVKEEIGVKLMLRRVDFWLYFMVYLCGATIGLVYLNNLGQIAESRGSLVTTSVVALSSCFTFFGRLLPPLLHYFLARTKYMISPPASIAISMAPMACSFFLLLNNTNIALYIATAIIGICTGAITSLAVPTTTELFGTKNFSVNHNVLVANIPIGSFIFGYSSALIYRHEAFVTSNGSYGFDENCIGLRCYRLSFILWGSLCFLGTFLALVLYARTRKFYSRIRLF